MEVETEPNVYDQYKEYVKQVEVKQLDDISAEVEGEKNADQSHQTLVNQGSLVSLCTVQVYRGELSVEYRI